MKFKNVLYVSAVLSLFVSTTSFASPVIWVSDGQGDLGTVDVTTGYVTNVGRMSATMYDLAFDSAGDLFGINEIGLYRISTTNAATTYIGGGAFLNSLIFDSAGTLYAANTSLYTINTATGVATLVGGNGTYNSAGDLAFINGELYLSSKGITQASDKLVKIDTTTGYGTVVGDIGYGASSGNGSVYGLASNNGVDLYGVSGTSVFTISVLTGGGSSPLSTYTNSTLGVAYGSAFYGESNPVPEPATMLLLGAGIAGIAGARMRKKK